MLKRAVFKGEFYEVFGSDLRIHISSNTLFTYPDAAIVCGELQSLDDTLDVALNPAVIIEILSPSTQSYDKGKKFMLCQSIKTSKEYILIDSVSVKVEQHIYQSDDNWLMKEYTSLSDTFLIQSIQHSFPMNKLFNEVSI